jgi:conjugal transfer pilus assembly protein TraK
MKLHKYPRHLVALACLLLASFSWADAPAPDSIPAIDRPHSDAVKKAPAKKEWNSTEVNPATAVKNTPAKEINLPGVMKIEGASTNALDFTRARTIQMNNGGSVSVYLSSNEPNRIQLPFVNPHVIGTTDVMIDKRAKSNNIYVAFKQGVTKPVPIFIETDDGSGPVLGLQLIPKGIASQTIIVEDVAPRTASDASKSNKGSEYVASTQGLMETVALNATPNGYSIVEINVPPIAMNGLLVEVEKKLSNREADIFVYRVLNPGPAATTVRESEFDGDLVQAISVHPKPNLKAGESTRVIVLARKEQKAKGQ